MNGMNKYVVLSVVILTTAIVLSLTPMIGDRIEQSNPGFAEVESISVFVLDEGTDATLVTCAIYNADTNRIIGTTEEQLITGDAWNVCEFDNAITVDPANQYVLVAFANGNISIPSDGTNYVTDSGNTYDSFPTYIDYAGTETSQISIYAIYA